MIDFVKAFRIDEYPQIAFVGAGGKSSTIFRLVSEYSGPIVVTTTTHLAKSQNRFTESHYILLPESDFSDLKMDDIKGSLLITGPQLAENRWPALFPNQLQTLSRLLRSQGIPLLIEADGARQKFLKGSADHEPAIPNFVDQVVVVAGLTALGETLTSKFVHRPDRFANVAQMEEGEKITSEHIFRVLSHKLGGLKNIPTQARQIVLLNHIENEALLGNVQALSSRYLQHFHALISASTQNEGIHAVYERSAGIILAAGQGSRYGGVKQLLEWQGESFVKGISLTALSSKLNNVHLVLGAYYEKVRAEINSLNLKIVHNKNWEEGQSTSVIGGLASLDLHVGSALFMLVDQPQLSTSLIDALLNAHDQSMSSIIAPQVDGQRGNPVLFDRRTFQEFSGLKGDVGGKALFSRHRVEWLPWLDASQAIDVDTPADFVRLNNYR